MTVPHLLVACAIIERDGLVLAAQRSERMSLPLKWEFPGGKIAPGEEPEQALHRELAEELGVRVRVRRAISPVTHAYASFLVTLHPFVCSLTEGEITLVEHSAARWLAPEGILEVDWADADLPVVAAFLATARTGS